MSKRGRCLGVSRSVLMRFPYRSTTKSMEMGITKVFRSSSVVTLSRSWRPTLRKCGFQGVTAVCITLSIHSCFLILLHLVLDVGGGSVANGTRNTLARIPLRWMIRECFKTDIGILFHGSMFKQIGLDPATLYPHVTERPPPIYGNAPEPNPDAPEPADSDPQSTFISEEKEDLADALSPIYDQLRISWPWWILEVIPQKQQFQKDGDNKWDTEFRCVLIYFRCAFRSVILMSLFPSPLFNRMPGRTWAADAIYRDSSVTELSCIGPSRYVWKQTDSRVGSIGPRRS